MNIAIVLIWILTGVTTGVVASDKGHGFGSWTIAGLLLGPFGLIAAAGLSDQKLREYIRRTIDPTSIYPLNNTQNILNQTEPYRDSTPKLLQASQSSFDFKNQQDAKQKFIGDFLLNKNASENQIWTKILEILEFHRPELVPLVDRSKSNINLSLTGGKALKICKSNKQKLALAYAKERAENDNLYWQVKIY